MMNVCRVNRNVSRICRLLVCVAVVAMVVSQASLVMAWQSAPGSTDDTAVLRGLQLTPRAFRLAVQKIDPCLVTIESFGGSSTNSGEIGGIRMRGEGNTTGVMVSPDGLAITSSFNFIDQPGAVTVLTRDGERRVANVLGRDDTRRICLLKIEGVENMPVPEMVPVDEVRVGQWAVSVGVGYGDSSPAISMGIISAKNRIGGRAIQTDANISPANYGGPLLDIEGRMIGLCVPMSADSQDLGSGVEWYDSGIGFAIPLADAGGLIQRMSQGTHIRRAFLGIQSENSDESDGTRITQVVPNSAADQAELTVNDVLLKLDDQPLPNVAELRAVLAKYYAGDRVTIQFRRADEEKSVELELGAPPRPELEDTPSLFPGRRRPAPGG